MSYSKACLKKEPTQFAMAGLWSLYGIVDSFITLRTLLLFIGFYFIGNFCIDPFRMSFNWKRLGTTKAWKVALSIYNTIKTTNSGREWYSLFFTSIRFLHVHLRHKSFEKIVGSMKKEEEEETSDMNDIRGRYYIYVWKEV